MLDVKEMNANILIGMHNMWTYDKLFEGIRNNIDRIDEYIQDLLEENFEE